jgi:hypothetical protein
LVQSCDPYGKRNTVLISTCAKFWFPLAKIAFESFDFHMAKETPIAGDFVIVLARQRFVEPPGPTAPVAKSQ